MNDLLRDRSFFSMYLQTKPKRSRNARRITRHSWLLVLILKKVVKTMKKQTVILPKKLELQLDNEQTVSVTPTVEKSKTLAPYIPQYLSGDAYHTIQLGEGYDEMVIDNEPTTGFDVTIQESSQTITDIVQKEQDENHLAPHTIRDPRGFTLQLTNQNINLLINNNPNVFVDFHSREFCYAFALGRDKNLFLVETNSPAYEEAYDPSEMRYQNVTLKPKEIEEHASRNGVILTNKRGERVLYLGKMTVKLTGNSTTKHICETLNIDNYPLTKLAIKHTTAVPSYVSIELLTDSTIRDAIMERLRDLSPINPIITELSSVQQKTPLTFDELKDTWLAPLYNQTLITAPRWFGSIPDTNREIPSPIDVIMERTTPTYSDSDTFEKRPLWFYDEYGKLHVGHFRLNIKKLGLSETDTLKLQERIKEIYDTLYSWIYHKHEPHLFYSHNLVKKQTIARNKFIESKRNGHDKNEQFIKHYERNRKNLNAINMLLATLYNVDTLHALEIESMPYFADKQGLVDPHHTVETQSRIIAVTDIGTTEKIYPVDVLRANGDVAVKPLKGDFYLI